MYLFSCIAHLIFHVHIHIHVCIQCTCTVLSYGVCNMERGNDSLHFLSIDFTRKTVHVHIYNMSHIDFWKFWLSLLDLYTMGATCTCKCTCTSTYMYIHINSVLPNMVLKSFLRREECVCCVGKKMPPTCTCTSKYMYITVTEYPSWLFSFAPNVYSTDKSEIWVLHFPVFIPYLVLFCILKKYPFLL